MSDAPPIPQKLWRQVLAFIRNEKSGEIRLQVDRGIVRKLTVVDQPRASVTVEDDSS